MAGRVRIRRRGAGSLVDLVAEVRQGRPRAVARAISLVEDQDVGVVSELAGLLTNGTSAAHLVGITGPPGVGKSTVVDAMVAQWRQDGRRVGVLAVDPSSPFTGGALLGDRVRMQRHTGDRDVVIRSMASRGHLGGLATATPLAVRVLAAAGCEVVCVETVGVGQSEVEVAGTCDTVCVLASPGAGDQVQAAKAGLLEIGDVFVVNKAERDGAQAVVRDLRSMVALAAHPGDRAAEGASERQTGEVPPVRHWKPPVVTTTATTGEGIDDLVREVAAHRAWATDTGQWELRRRRRARAEIEALVVASVRRRFGDAADPTELARLAAEVAAGRVDAHSAAERLVAAWAPDVS